MVRVISVHNLPGKLVDFVDLQLHEIQFAYIENLDTFLLFRAGVAIS